MKVKGFGARPARNVSSGGQNSSFDEYNRSFKGDPYNFAYKKKNYRDSTGFMSRSVEEYYHVPEMKDTTTEQDDQNNRSSNRSDSSSSARAKASKARQAVIRQVAAVVAGSVVVVGGYQASLKIRSQPPVDPKPPVVDVDPTEDPGVTTTSSWEWSDDFTAAVLVLTDTEGNIVSEVEATVTTAEDPAGCTTDGKRTYTATASANGRTYTDTQEEELPALGHDFDDGTEITLADGRTAMDFECTRCHEHFTIVNSISEE
jgi:hypothetical protein